MNITSKKHCTLAAMVMLIAVTMFVVSCKKTDIPKDEETTAFRFFRHTAPGSPVLKRVMDELKKRQSQNPTFIPSLVARHGYVVWDKSTIKIRTANITSGRTNETQNDTIILLPLVHPQGHTVNAYIEAHLTDTVRLNLYQSDAYTNYPYGNLNSSVNNAEKFALEFMLLDNKVFGYSRFRIIDTTLFRHGMTLATNCYGVFNISNVITSTERISGSAPDDCYEVEIWYDPDGDSDPSDNSGNEYFTGVTYWVGDCGSGSLGGGFGLGFGNGNNNNIGGLGSGNPGGTGGGGWEPLGGGSGSGVADPDYDLYNKSISDNYTGDENNNTDGDNDTTGYQSYSPGALWPSISNVIPVADFVGWGTPGINKNCMEYAKAQIAKKNYRISNYGTPGQTIQVYKSSTGADHTAVKDGIGYLIAALKRGIPVIVGVDDRPESSNPQTDNTTDHFVVIVGMGTDAKGDYFTFYDNASGDRSQGTSSGNKLYFNPVTWLITGRSQTNYASGLRDYIVTMIRKSK